MKKNIKQVPFTVDVEGIGAFTFRWRTMRTQFAVEAEYSRLTEGVATPTESLKKASRVIAELNTLAVEVPEDWDIDSMDPFDPEDADKIQKVYIAFTEREQFFRSGGGPERKEPSEGQQPQS